MEDIALWAFMRAKIREALCEIVCFAKMLAKALEACLYAHICRPHFLVDKHLCQCPSFPARAGTGAKQHVGWAILEQVSRKPCESPGACCRVPHFGPRTEQSRQAQWKGRMIVAAFTSRCCKLASVSDRHCHWVCKRSCSSSNDPGRVPETKGVATESRKVRERDGFLARNCVFPPMFFLSKEFGWSWRQPDVDLLGQLLHETYKTWPAFCQPERQTCSVRDWQLQFKCCICACFAWILYPLLEAGLFQPYPWTFRRL